jgi:HlyD family secretion protein
MMARDIVMREATPPESPVTSREALASIHVYLRGGVAIVVALVFGLGGLAYGTQISGAVIGIGQVVIESEVKKIQHQNGGTVGELLVKEGARVQAGDLLLRLDDVVLRSNLGVIQANLDEMAARQARLEAERDAFQSITFPAALWEQAKAESRIEKLLTSEQRVFDLRGEARDGQRAQLRERIAQLHKEMEGLNAQIAANKQEVVLMGKELESVRDLWRKNLVPISRVTSIERDSVRTGGEGGRLISSLAAAGGKVSEIELQVLQIDQDLRSEVAKELREIQARTSELRERRIAAEDQLRKTDLRAPQSGVVHQLQVHVKGEVLPANEPVMMIVPNQDALAVDVRVAPTDIDQVHVGQASTLRFPSFSARTTPEIDAVVSRVSADAETDKRTGASFFSVRIALEQKEVVKLGTAKLVPGMPVEAFIQTQQRSMLSYLLKPVSDQMARAFREK